MLSSIFHCLRFTVSKRIVKKWATRVMCLEDLQKLSQFFSSDDLPISSYLTWTLTGKHPKQKKRLFLTYRW